MATIAQVLKAKGTHEVYAIAPDETVYQAVRKMSEHNVGALLVMDSATIVGIVTERDYARKMVLAGRSSKETPVSTIMTPEVLCVTPRQTTEECMAIMTRHRVRHLPVLDHERLVGLVSIGDLVKDIISEQQFIIEQLEHYIAGSR
jgi:CBS domain-containing protein